MIQEKRKKRAHEIDVIRGICIVLMMWHHFMYDIRYIFHYDACIFFESNIFQNIIHPLLLIGLFMVSGISNSFSTNNMRRTKKIALIAIALTVLTSLLSWILSTDLYILWQILHSLAFCIFLTSLLDKTKLQSKLKQVIYICLGLTIIFILPLIIKINQLDSQGPAILLPLGIGYLQATVPTMIDYIPLIPYAGFFFFGAALGPIFYPEGKVKHEYCTGQFWKPMRFLGRYSLWIYAIHQPVFIFLIWLFGRMFL